MKKIGLKIVALSTLLVVVLSNIGCASSASSANQTTQTTQMAQAATNTKTETANTTDLGNQKFSGKTLNVKLGYKGKTYILELFSNQTAEDIYNHVSLATWNLPIYEFSGYISSNIMIYQVDTR